MGRICQEHVRTRAGLPAGCNKLFCELDVETLDVLIIAAIQACQMDDRICLPDHLLETGGIAKTFPVNLKNLDLRFGVAVYS